MYNTSGSLTTEDKWKPVDTIIMHINARREKGEEGCRNPLEEYVDAIFNRKNNPTLDQQEKVKC